MKFFNVAVLAACSALLGNVAFGADADEIIRMKRAGVSDDVMLAYIENSNHSQELSDSEMKRLEDEGVSASVIVAMADRKTSVAATVETRSDSPRTVAEPVNYSPAGEASVEYVHAPPKENLNISFFYDSLGSHGKWHRHTHYGWVWQPSVIVTETSWRPYCDNGHWVWTDHGWYWESDYPWGWAAFHYGRWYHDAHIGWVWQPGTTWGPAWVHWRESHSHYGWAPLPPEADFEIGVGFRFRNEKVGFDFHFGLNESHYAFVPSDRFLTRNIRTVAIPRTQVTNVYNKTTIVNNTYVYNDNRVINQGVPQQQVASRTRQKIETVKIADASVTTGQAIKPERRDGQKLTVFRPQLAKTAPEDPPTVLSRKQARAEASAEKKEQRQERQQATQQNNAERREQRQQAQVSEEQAKKRLEELKRGRKIVKEFDEKPQISTTPAPKQDQKREQKAKAQLEDIKRSREIKAQQRNAPEAKPAEPKARKPEERPQQAPAVQPRKEPAAKPEVLREERKEKVEAQREERKGKVETQREERQEKAGERREQQRERQEERREKAEDRKEDRKK